MSEITCPSCHNRGRASTDSTGAFEVRGQFEGRAVRKCKKCGAGLLIGTFSGGLLGSPKVIPDELWQKMEQRWREEFGNPLENTAELNIEAIKTESESAVAPGHEGNLAFARLLKLIGTRSIRIVFIDDTDVVGKLTEVVAPFMKGIATGANARVYQVERDPNNRCYSTNTPGEVLIRIDRLDVSKIVDYETSIVLFEISDKWQISAYEVARTLIPTQEYFETVWPTVAEFTPDDSKEKVKSEFYFLMVFAYDLAIYLTLDGGEQAAVREEYYRFLDENNPEIVNDILERTKMYVEAANNPHPEYGMSYAVGKRFVEVCDIADIAILTAAGETFQNLLKSGKNFLDEVTKKFKIVLSER